MAKFLKGNTHSVGRGRPKKDNKLLVDEAKDMILDFLVKEGIPTLIKNFRNGNEREQRMIISELAVYAIPQLAKTEVTGDAENPLMQRIEVETVFTSVNLPQTNIPLGQQNIIQLKGGEVVGDSTDETKPLKENFVVLSKDNEEQEEDFFEDETEDHQSI